MNAWIPSISMVNNPTWNLYKANRNGPIILKLFTWAYARPTDVWQCSDIYIYIWQCNDNYINFISAYMSMINKNDDDKVKLCEEVTQASCGIPHREQILLIVEFNVRVGRGFETWPKVLGRHGIENMNSNGQLFAPTMSRLRTSHHQLVTPTNFCSNFT